MTDLQYPSFADFIPSENALADRVILVTGAGDGLGRSASLAFARHGATVILLGRTVKKLEDVYDEIEAAGGPQPAIFPLKLDKATPEDFEAMAQSINDNFGRLDGLLHNAAELDILSPLRMADVPTWNRVLQTNLTAPFLITRACLDLLSASHSASIVFTSDQLGRKGRAYWNGYAVSKFGIEGLMQTLADELSDTNIRVNSLAPVPVATILRTRAYPGENPNSLPKPDDVMGSYLYLMSDASKAVNGVAVAATPATQ
ncbi:MAG TPA: YciK family oxidoreductase [Chromatiaceae bacterium]|jgi:NAD(P)-dependent dehydrogenase (short-subunit alcohol dehydrogenase family)|nr:YciK family oxidoreductase [Chromatiaceae bacterium]HIA07534.1 YciK family oxidoreductase [Chromatiaceae bacterium]HIN83147.1 YciK family oxidoreductase [Chromatiales bacterium]HIO55283.1 YciK family oxidoreductase [Chromatiales bacterium]